MSQEQVDTLIETVGCEVIESLTDAYREWLKMTMDRIREINGVVH